MRKRGESIYVSIMIVHLINCALVMHAHSAEPRALLSVTADLNGDGAVEKVSLMHTNTTRKHAKQWYLQIRSRDRITRSKAFEALGPYFIDVSLLPRQLVQLSVVSVGKALYVADVNLDGRLEIVAHLRLPMSRSNCQTIVAQLQLDDYEIKEILNVVSDGIMFTDLNGDGKGEALPWIVQQGKPFFPYIYVWRNGKYLRTNLLPKKLAKIMLPYYRRMPAVYLRSALCYLQLRECVRMALLLNEPQAVVEAMAAVTEILNSLKIAEEELKHLKAQALIAKGDLNLTYPIEQHKIDAAFDCYCEAYKLKPDKSCRVAEGWAAAHLAKQLALHGEFNLALKWIDYAERVEGRKFNQLREWVREQAKPAMPQKAER